MRWLTLLLAGVCAGVEAQTLAAPPASAPSHEQARELVRSLQVASPYRISEAARSGEIDYRLSFAGTPPWALPETGEQHVEADPATGRIRVTVCRDCGRESAPTRADLQRYRAPSPWIESKHRQITAFARRHARGNGVRRRMTKLRDAVQAHMTGPIDFRHYDSAATALQSRSGDCTEFAVLLAAVARADGIPARIAYGVAYSSRFTGQGHVFSPHAWVQAWDGQRWRSYDAGLGRFGAGHLALLVGDGTSTGLAAMMRAITHLRIEAAVGIRKPPGPADSVQSSSP